LGSGATSNDACVDYGVAPSSVYAPLNTPVGPNIGDFLYQDISVSIPVVNGWYSNGTFAYQVTGGMGQISTSVPC